MNYLALVGVIFLLCAYAGSNVAKSGVEEDTFYSSMEIADNNLTAVSLLLMSNYTNTSKPSMERGVALFSGAAVGFMNLIGLEATKYGYTNPQVDYQIFAWLLILIILLPYIAILLRPVCRVAGRIIYGL